MTELMLSTLMSCLFHGLFLFFFSRLFSYLLQLILSRWNQFLLYIEKKKKKIEWSRKLTARCSNVTLLIWIKIFITHINRLVSNTHILLLTAGVWKIIMPHWNLMTIWQPQHERVCEYIRVDIWWKFRMVFLLFNLFEMETIRSKPQLPENFARKLIKVHSRIH